jgi:hypothetical protein
MRRGGIVAAGLAVLIASALAVYALRQQQAANREILSRLDDVRSSLRDEAARSSGLTDQVTALSERVVRLESDNRDLRRQLARVLNRKPVGVALLTVPAPLDAIPLAPLAEHSMAEPSGVFIEPIPITWATDWSSYQPAGIIAPPAPLVLHRRLTDPAFVKKMYFGLGALHATDAVTTLVVINRGGREMNPLLQGAVGNPAALFAIKAGIVAGTVFAIENVRREHPVLATASLIAINGTLAAIAVNNVTVAARQKKE